AGPRNTVLHLAFLGDDNKLAVGAYGDGKLTLWDPQTGKQVDTIAAPGPGFEVGAIAPQGALVAFEADHPARIQLRSCATKKEVQKFNLDPNDFQRFAVSPDGAMIATAERGEGVDRSVRIYGVPMGKLIATAESADQSYSDLRFSPDGKALAVVD